MSINKVINAGEDLLGNWYVKVFAFPKGTTPNDHPTLMSNLHHRDFLPITDAVSAVTQLRREHECNAVRVACPMNSVLAMVKNLAVCKCDNTQQWFIVGEMKGHTVLGKQCLTKESFYSIGFAGWKTATGVTNISYLTIDIDFSDTHQPLAISHYEEIKTWCERNKQTILKHILSS